MLQRILLVNGLLTSIGLVMDIAGVVALNSLAVAALGVACGIIDTVTFMWIARQRKKAK